MGKNLTLPEQQPLSAKEQTLVRRFHQLWYDRHLWSRGVHWRGQICLKNPLDLWMLQEVVWQTKPDIIIELGTAKGGAALFLADLLELYAPGPEQYRHEPATGWAKVLTVDLADPSKRPEHWRVRYFQGNSTDPGVRAQLERVITAGQKVMVILDTDHTYATTKQELALWSPLVSPGCYLVVEDTNIGGYPVQPARRENCPRPAVAEFLANHPEFVLDKDCERYLFTFNPGGWLRRTS